MGENFIDARSAFQVGIEHATNKIDSRWLYMIPYLTFELSSTLNAVDNILVRILETKSSGQCK